MEIKGVIFDMDGTVVESPYDWRQIKEKLMTQRKPILAFINELKEPEKSEKWKLLEKYENEATIKAILKQGMREFLDFLAKKKIKKALVTNNSRKNVSYLLKKFNLKFDCVISRENGLWKPTGLPFLAAMNRLKLSEEECCVVGDSPFDIQAATEAGISRVFILNKDKERFASTNAAVVPSVEALQKKIERLLAAES